MSEKYHMIDDAGALCELVARLRDEPCVAVDTEFVWERTFFARLGLVQLGTSDGNSYLLDTVAVSDISPLGEILADPRITKILHDAPQDLMILRRATGTSTHNVFDTRLAAGFAGLSAVLSLQNLLDEVLDVQIPKGQARTDWIARPLSEHQLVYAVDDVLYLPRAADRLREMAREGGAEAWMDEELGTLDGSDLYEERDPGETYLRIRAAASLSPRGLASLRELAAWREECARADDRPRRRIVEDHELVSVARALPRRPEDLGGCRRLDLRTARRHGKALLAAVQRGLAVPEAELPVPLVTADLRRVGKERLAKATQVIRERAAKRGIDPQLVASKNDVALLLQAGAGAPPADHAMLRGWRAELLGDLVGAVDHPPA